MRTNEAGVLREAVQLCAHDGVLSVRCKSVPEYATAP